MLSKRLLTWAVASCNYLYFWKLTPSDCRCANGNCLPVSDNIKHYVNNTENKKATTWAFYAAHCCN